MSHLTKDNRERIARKAVNSTYEPRNEKMKKREADLAMECYNHVFPKKLRDILAEVPKDWLRHCDCLRFNAAGWNINLKAAKEVPTPASNYCGMLGDLTGDLAKKVQDFSQEKKAFEEEWRGAYAKMLGFLDSFRTFKKLKEAWPEGKKFYQEYDADRPSAKVPAVITKEINAMLGLKDKAA